MSTAPVEPVNRGRLMLASFLTLVASGVGFATRAAMAGPWEGAFNIGAEDFGRIMGAGFLGFGVMIFFGGIITEKLGYRFVLFVAFLLHLVSAAALFGARPLYASLQASSPGSFAGPSHESQFNVAGIGSLPAGRSMPCGQMGRLLQT